MSDTMKTDRELLELAAKAAGLTHIDYTNTGYDGRYGLVTTDCYGRHGPEFDPLNDDGDALRMAVKLTLEVDICLSGVAVRTPHGDKILVDDRDEKCIYAATRRAITRAAAAVGEGMK